MAAGARRDVEISGLTADSRAVAPGYLFAALPGARLDGARFIADAAARGARATARKTLIERLDDVDRTLLASARSAVGAELEDLEADARTELASFWSRLDADAFRRAVDATVDSRLRARLRLPAVRFEGGPQVEDGAG